MSWFERYIAYLKDNPKGYWFKRKLYGWGWTPVSWEGWLVTIALIAFVLWRAFTFEAAVGATEPANEQLFRFFAEVIGAVLVLIVIAWRKGERPKWQWGIPKEGNSHEDPR